MSLDGEEQADGRVLIVTPYPQPDLVCSVCVSHSLSPTVHLICLSKLAMHGKLNFESSYTRAVPAPEYTCVRTTATKSVIQRTSHTTLHKLITDKKFGPGPHGGTCQCCCWARSDAVDGGGGDGGVGGGEDDVIPLGTVGIAVELGWMLAAVAVEFL